MKRVAVVGGGWAGLAAAVTAVQRGDAVTLFEMAPALGGRARAVDVTVDGAAERLDNGQHILIGAYTATLRLLATLGVDAGAAFVRSPLRLLDARGQGLALPAGAPMPAFVRGVLGNRRWSLRDRVALLSAASGWSLRRFRCDPRWSVADLTRHLPDTLRRDLIEPLCVAALNTPAAEASATVFLRVLRDALFAGPGSADLLLPRVDLSRLLPDPAEAWLRGHGVDVRLSQRVTAIEPAGTVWKVDGEPVDRVVMAATSHEARRLVEPIAPAWAASASALRHEPIVTVYAHAPGARLAAPMVSLDADDAAPAQFVFDRGQLGGRAGLLAFVISGAQPWVDRGAEATLDATVAQARTALGLAATPLRLITEKRATFRCTPLLARPGAFIAPGLAAAGDFVDGPYPATLEGAVRSGIAAIQAAGSQQTIS